MSGSASPQQRAGDKARPTLQRKPATWHTTPNNYP